MKIEIIPCLNDNYSYLIFEKETNTVSIVDPSEFNSCDRIVQKYKKLDYILNTHHHFDHVDGNLKLKKKYNSKVLGFDKDKERIPGIDIKLKDNQKFKIGDLEFKVIFVPGHTNGHISFYFEKEKILFSGDTLFSLGCGKVFEGTHKDMFNSLNKLKSLSPDTKIYCGHEYTKKNYDFCIKYDPENSFLKEKAKLINSKLKDNLPTVPSNLTDELKTNVFLRCNDKGLKQTLNLKDCSDQEIFTKLRDLKDTF
jgi:hydroxyacylglutathione hydrolase